MGPFGLFVVNSTCDALLYERLGTELNIALTGPWSHLYRVSESSTVPGLCSAIYSWYSYYGIGVMIMSTLGTKKPKGKNELHGDKQMLWEGFNQTVSEDTS